MYKVDIIKSIRELSVVDRIRCKDISTASKFDDVVSDDRPFNISIKNFVLLHVHNDSAKENTEYDVSLCICDNGEKYVTGSESFIRSVEDILEELEDIDFNSIELKIHKIPSKNYAGRCFLKASLENFN